MGVRGKAERALDVVQVYTEKVVGTDALNKDVTEMVLKESVRANVERFSGSRLAYFKTLGYTYPIEITMYKREFAQLRVDGKVVQVSSVQTDTENELKVVILGDLVGNE